jgi:preprotein translocase subunit YajC
MIKSKQPLGAVMTFINQYSFLIVAVVAILLLGFYLLRKRIERSSFIAIAALVFGILFAFLLLRPGSSSSQETEDVLAQIGSGRPVLLQFQSNY